MSAMEENQVLVLLNSASSETLLDCTILTKCSIWQNISTNRVLQSLRHKQKNLKAKQFFFLKDQHLKCLRHNVVSC